EQRKTPGMVVLPQPQKPHRLQRALPELHPRLQAELPGNRCPLPPLLVQTVEAAGWRSKTDTHPRQRVSRNGTASEGDPLAFHDRVSSGEVWNDSRHPQPRQRAAVFQRTPRAEERGNVCPDASRETRTKEREPMADNRKYYYFQL